MDLTVDSLKIGSKLVFGKYGVNNENPQPIIWLKASPNCVLSPKAYSIISASTPENRRQNPAWSSITATHASPFPTSSTF